MLATSSPSHHAYLRSTGAARVFDYRDPDVAKHIIDAVEEQTPAVPFILDCIGSQRGSIAPIAKIAQRGTKVAILLPVIVKDATEKEEPDYSMDVQSQAQWAEGVEVKGVRTHFYAEASLIVHCPEGSKLLTSTRTSSFVSISSQQSSLPCLQTAY